MTTRAPAHAVSLADLLPARGFQAGGHRTDDGGRLRYSIHTDAEGSATGVLRHHDRAGGSRSWVVGGSTLNALAGGRVPLGSGELLAELERQSTTGVPLEDGGAGIRDLALDAPKNPAGENSVQTEDEAAKFTDPGLIDQILTIFEDSTCKELLQEKIDLVSTVLIPTFDAAGKLTGKEPLTQTTYLCVRGDLIPELILWDPKFILIASRKHVKVNDVKDFMFKNVKESSKISFGLGITLASPTGVEAAGPEAGEDVFEDGKPKKDASGKVLGFDASMVKTYSELTIRAQRRLTVEIGGYETTRFPRS